MARTHRKRLKIGLQCLIAGAMWENKEFSWRLPVEMEVNFARIKSVNDFKLKNQNFYKT